MHRSRHQKNAFLCLRRRRRILEQPKEVVCRGSGRKRPRSASHGSRGPGRCLHATSSARSSRRRRARSRQGVCADNSRLPDGRGSQRSMATRPSRRVFGRVRRCASSPCRSRGRSPTRRQAGRRSDRRQRHSLLRAQDRPGPPRGTALATRRRPPRRPERGRTTCPRPG